MEVSENFPPRRLWHNDEIYLLSIEQNKFEDNQCFLGAFYSAVPKGYYVPSMECGEVRCGPFILS